MVYHRPVASEGEPFMLSSVSKEEPPAGAEGLGWYRYVITQADNTIVGYRRGNTSSVTIAVKDIVLRLNERRAASWSPTFLIRRSTPR